MSIAYYPARQNLGHKADEQLGFIRDDLQLNEGDFSKAEQRIIKALVIQVEQTLNGQTEISLLVSPSSIATLIKSPTHKDDKPNNHELFFEICEILESLRADFKLNNIIPSDIPGSVNETLNGIKELLNPHENSGGFPAVVEQAA